MLPGLNPNYDELLTYNNGAIATLILDHYKPAGERLAIQLINKEYLMQLFLFPLIPLTTLFNPYRTYQFFTSHPFISGFPPYQSLSSFTD